MVSCVNEKRNNLEDLSVSKGKIMQAIWATDIHLNFVPREERLAFFASITSRDADMVFLTGDIAEAPSLEPLFAEMAQFISTPIYFVLGNHDFYYGSISHVQQSAGRLSQTHQNLTYLSQVGIVELSPTTGLVGQDGWGDGRYGNFQRSPVILNDHTLIKDLKELDRATLHTKLRQLGEKEAESLEKKLTHALERYPRVILLTHVPPFKEACWYQGEIGNDDWLPFFTCKAVGDLLIRLMETHPRHQLTVLCGHTHHPGTAEIRPNLTVHTGPANYGTPAIHQVLELE